jgi:hypothetical protein
MVLLVVAVNIADLALRSHHEPVSYWMCWFLIVMGLIVLIQWPFYKKKIAKALSEQEEKERGDTQ